MSETKSRLHPHLTKTEIYIIRAILAGHTTAKAIGEFFEISPRTLQSHLSHIYIKTGAENKTDLVLMALGRKQGLIDVQGQLSRWSKSRSL